MILATHAIWSAYGFWLPNEQRGSWSTEVWAPNLKRFGPATKTTQSRSLANDPYDRELRSEMRDSLKYPAVRSNEAQVQSIARGFDHAINLFNMIVFACAIMPDHVHMVISRHSATVEYLVGVLKRAATRQLTADGVHPLVSHARANGTTPTPWVEGGWFRYLNADDEIADAISYVEGNRNRIGKPRQAHPFVMPFAGSAPRGRGG